ncbi:hypothetical protein P3T21_005587 [Paraburkholderia sp. GAS334]
MMRTSTNVLVQDFVEARDWLQPDDRITKPGVRIKTRIAERRPTWAWSNVQGTYDWMDWHQPFMSSE